MWNRGDSEFNWKELGSTTFKSKMTEFSIFYPGGPVAGTLCFQAQGPGFDGLQFMESQSWTQLSDYHFHFFLSENYIPFAATKTHYSQINKYIFKK